MTQCDAAASIAKEAIDVFYDNDGLADYEQVRTKIEEFKATLAEAAKRLSTDHGSHPLVVIIDELENDADLHMQLNSWK